MDTLGTVKYESRILIRKLRTYVVCGALLFHFLDINPVGKVKTHLSTPHYIINETTFFIIDFASIWVMFLVADIMLKEKNLKMKEIVCTKPIKKSRLFWGKLITCLFFISAMVGLIFIMAWVGEIYAGTPPSLTAYVMNYVLDVVPMMIFSVSILTLLSMLFRNTKITYILYFLCWLFLISSLVLIIPPEYLVLFGTYNSNLHSFSVSLHYQIFLKGVLLLISFAFSAIAYMLYSRYFLREEGGFS
jgi:ABC-type transport system involved in multi-copper enzyme maturation permease subunit